jgi:hypothetical protein
MTTRTPYAPTTLAQRAGAVSLATVVTLSVLFGLDHTADEQYGAAVLAQAAPATQPVARSSPGASLLAQAAQRKPGQRG